MAIFVKGFSRFIVLTFFTIVFVCYFSVSSFAQNNLVFLGGVGIANIIDRPSKGYCSLELRQHFTLKQMTFSVNYSLEGNSKDNFMGLGVSFVKPLSNKFSLVLTTGFGRYSNKYFYLGSKFEFRSGIELFYNLIKNLGVDFSFYHYSNAGISQHNPGTECIVVRFIIPITKRK